MNELDSALMAGILQKKGLTKAISEDKADILIFNTCAVRDLAERKVLGKLGLMSRKKKSHLLIGITGCMPMTSEKILSTYPYVDFVLGTNNIMDLNEVIDEAFDRQMRICKTEKKHEHIDPYLISRDNPLQAYVSIIRGCNKFCSYCIVPFTRGREISKERKNVIEEVKILVDKGIKEVTLLGQNVNSYGKDLEDKTSFSDLLYFLNDIKGLERIRFLTSHPVDITIDLMHAVRDLSKVCEYIHFPLQAGSNVILEKMRRMYTAEAYLEKVNLFKSIVPNVKIGTDMIVGFPTETEEDFEKSCELFYKIKFSQAFIFAYSARVGTLAQKTYKDDVSAESKKKRLNALLDIFHKTLHEEMEKSIGTIEEVLVEGLGKNTGTLKGKTRGFEKVIFSTDQDLIGKICKVKITSVNHETYLANLTQHAFYQ
jgi:tRNA-2-methylthio-N6-dimethylallyladenosine synthase